MTAKPYAPQSWSDNEPIFTEKLNAMTNNDQYLFESMPTVYYNAHGVKKTAGVKMMTGSVNVPAKNATGSANTFYFGNFFSSGCKPMVVTSINTHPYGRYHAITRGIGTFWPDHRGFEIRVYANDPYQKPDTVKGTIWVNFIAIGW